MADESRTPYYQPVTINVYGRHYIGLRFASTQERDAFAEKLRKEREQADGR